MSSFNGMSGVDDDADRSPAGSYEEPSFMAMMTARPQAAPIGGGPIGGGGVSLSAMPMMFNVKDVSAKNNQLFNRDYIERPECIISFRDSGVKSHPFVISHTNLTFDQIPFVTGVPIKRQFYPPRSHLAPANFETTSDWSHIEPTIKGFFDSKGIRYCLPGTIAVFSVHGIAADPNLVFDVHCCPRPIDVVTNSPSFVIEFRRVRGDAFILSKLFFELKAKLVVDDGTFSRDFTGGDNAMDDADSTTNVHPHQWNINIDLGYYDQNHKWINLDAGHGAMYRKDKKQLICRDQ